MQYSILDGIMGQEKDINGKTGEIQTAVLNGVVPMSFLSFYECATVMKYVTRKEAR